MKTNMYANEAKMFAEAIRKLAASPDALDNLECYLSTHFGEWLEKYANSPESFAAELHEFSTIHES